MQENYFGNQKKASGETCDIMISNKKRIFVFCPHSWHDEQSKRC